jgi:hypothetical protein
MMCIGVSRPSQAGVLAPFVTVAATIVTPGDESRMGNPVHYSREIPSRCLQLINGLWQHAEGLFQPDRRDLGHLTSTFLVSRSYPIINLPIERIERNRSRQEQGYADDRHIDPKLAVAVWQELGAKKLSEAPFFTSGMWSFCQSDVFNIAGGLPDNHAEKLATAEAHTSAADMPTSQWCGVLRNALAHGGVAYLNEHGRYAYEAPVSMYLFASGRFRKGDRPEDRPELIGLNLLRIKEGDYRSFLQQWVRWLQVSDIEAILEAA